MENFQDAVAAIVKVLPEWEKEGLNEAQTCQAIILRLLKAAGYNIWNPFEVRPQEYNGKYIPDFIIFFDGKYKLIIEAKLLGKELSDDNKKQALNYVNNEDGRRWAILTNGKQWIFLDNNVKECPIADKVALVLNLDKPHAGEFLGILLNRELWEAEGANERVAEKVQLIKITQELRSFLLRDTTFPHDERGVKLAIRYELAADKKVFAEQHLTTILALLFPQNTLPVEIPAAPTTQITSQATEEPLNVWQVLSTNLEKLESSGSRTYTIMFEGHTMNFATLPDIIVAVAETCLTCKTEQSLVFVAETYEYSKRLLSNHRYIPVNKSFNSAVNKVVKKQLESLGLPEGCITISSNKTSYTVP